MAYPVVASSSTGGANGAAVVTKPSGLAAGDFLVGIICAAGFNNNNADISPPDGTWTAIYSHNLSSGLKLASYYKTASSADAAATNFNWGFGDRTAAGMIRITGVDPASPILISNEGLASSTTAASSSGVTPARQGLLLQLVGYVASNALAHSVSGYAVANNNPSWTEIFDSSGITGGNQAGVAAAWANMTANANTATGNATATVTNTSDSLNMQILVLSSAAAYVASPLVLSTTLPAASFARRIVATALHLTATIGAAVMAAVAPTFRNRTKTAAASLTNRSKT